MKRHIETTTRNCSGLRPRCCKTQRAQRSNEKVIRDTKNWLVRSTINKGIDYKRKAARTVTMEKPLPETGEQTLDEASDILNAIAHLNEKEQTLVVLYSEGYSYKEIAEMTGRNLPSIGKTLSRILDKLKKVCYETLE